MVQPGEAVDAEQKKDALPGPRISELPTKDNIPEMGLTGANHSEMGAPEVAQRDRARGPAYELE